MVPSDRFFLKWAQDIAQCSSCTKIKVGAVLVKDHRVLACGYNGTPPGHENCCDHYHGAIFLSQKDFLEDHAKFSDTYECHAEQSAILDALSRGIDVKGGTVYCTYSPCSACCKVIIMAGIKRVVYINEYKKEPLQFLAQYCQVTRMQP